MEEKECLFCRIVEGKIPARIVYRDEEVVAFEDINPQAPVHILIIPKKHIPTLGDVSEEDVSVLGKIQLVARKIGEEKGILQEGARLVVNCNEGAGQAVFHLHYHLLGGRRFSWPPG